MTPIAMISLFLLAVGLIMGAVKPKRFGNLIVLLILGPVLISLAFTFVRGIFASLSQPAQILLILATALATLAILLRVALPRRTWEQVWDNFVYDVLKALVLLPFRMAAWLIKPIVKKLNR